MLGLSFPPKVTVLGVGRPRNDGPKAEVCASPEEDAFHTQASCTCTSMSLRHGLRFNAFAVEATTLTHLQRPSRTSISHHPCRILHFTSPSPSPSPSPLQIFHTVPRIDKLRGILADTTTSGHKSALWCTSVGRFRTIQAVTSTSGHELWRSVGKRVGRVGVRMGLPKPLGPHGVSFVEFELRRTSAGSEPGAKEKEGEGRQEQQQNGACNGAHAALDGLLPSAEGAPLMRIFYPTKSKKAFAPQDVRNRSWLPNVNYLMGFLSRAVVPTTAARRALVWTLSYLMYPFFYPFVPTQASVKQPLLIPENDFNKDGRLPVIIFSHGMWACRTTYTATCIDVASHGYIVVDVEHLDGSAVIAQYHDHKGKRRWVEHAYADIPFDDVPMSDRSAQLRQRVGEIQKTVDVLQALDQGLLSQNSNVIKGRTSLDVNLLKGRLNLKYLGMQGHSFGAATAIAVCCVDKRFKCCVAEDVWWAPMEEVDYERVAGNVPVLLLNTEKFDWKSLKDCRNKFLAARARTVGDAAVTELMTMKGTSHMDQSDFPLLFARALKRVGMAGKLDVHHAKDINSRASLDFFYKNLLPPGTGAPYLVDVVKEDGEYLVVSKVPGLHESSPV